MAAGMQKTRHPGIYRRGGRYLFSYRVNGKQKWESTRTLTEAQRLKARRVVDADRGELQERSRLTFREYAAEWVESYTGRGSGGFRESTREDYRRDLERWVFPFWGDRLRLSDLTPRHVAQLVAHLAKQKGKRGPLADTTIRSIVNPVRACLATAVEDGLIRSSPAQRVRLPHRPKPQDEDGAHVRALTREELAAFLKLVHPRHRLMFRVLAATGLRVSELLALQWRHLELDGSAPCVRFGPDGVAEALGDRVRRAVVRGRIEPPKSRHGKREIPLEAELVDALRAWRKTSEWPAAEDLAFPTLRGTAHESNNLLRRFLRPVAEEIGAPWAGFHTFRHTCASMLFERGANAVQVQRWLGHHSAASPSSATSTSCGAISESRSVWPASWQKCEQKRKHRRRSFRLRR